MIPSVEALLPGGEPVYQRGLVIDSQLLVGDVEFVVSISKGIGD